jgi:hypothetical protein
MPKTDDMEKRRAKLAAEAADRGMTVKEYLRELGDPMASVHARVPQRMVDDIDEEAKRRDMSRANVIRDRLERSPSFVATGARRGTP